jgi:hypothetical protein
MEVDDGAVAAVSADVAGVDVAAAVSPADVDQMMEVEVPATEESGVSTGLSPGVSGAGAGDVSTVLCRACKGAHRPHTCGIGREKGTGVPVDDNSPLSPRSTSRTILTPDHPSTDERVATTMDDDGECPTSALLLT